MKTITKFKSATLWMLGALATLPTLAHAHVGVGPTGGFGFGLAHPFTGLDHMAAMIAVGLWAAQRGGRALWVVPLTFVGVMSAGALVGAIGVSLPFVEQGIVASLLVLGVLVAASVRLPLVASSLLVGLFAIFHGHAHGVEMPATAAGVAYGVGFVTSTVALHATGIGFAMMVKKLGTPRLVRVAGGATALLGLVLLVV